MVAFQNIFTNRFKYLIIAWGIIVLFILMQMKLVGIYKPEIYWPMKDYFVLFISQMIIGTTLIYFYVIPFYDIIKQQKSLLFRVFLLLIHGLIFGIIHVFLGSLLNELKKNNTITDEFKDRFYNLFFTDLHNSIKTYLILISILFAYDFFKKSAQSIIREKNLENEVDKVKLKSLRAQLQPHFLFNALNNIVALIDENKKKAQQSLIYLSDLLRYTVNLEPLKLVSIQEEIQTIKTYLNIETSKYEEQLQVEWNIDENLKAFKVPPLIVQPLVENAIKHGFVDNTNILNVKISVKDGIIEVKNNGQPLNFTPLKGNGINLVEKRLSAHFGKNFNFTIKQRDGWVINTITIHDLL